MLTWLIKNWGLLLEIFVPLGIGGTILRIIFSRPKRVFGEAHLKAENGQVEDICWEIPVQNLRRYGWFGYFFKRNEAIECRVKIEFIMDDDFLYGPVEPWKASPIGKNLAADSEPHYFPLVATTFDGDIYFPNTQMSTNSKIPPYKIPSDSSIIAYIEVDSRIKPVAKSWWIVDVGPNTFTPSEVERID